MDVFDPDGNQVASGQSTEEELKVEVTVDAGEHAGQVWSLSIVKADVGIIEDSYLTLPEPLPPVISLVPEQAFSSTVE